MRQSKSRALLFAALLWAPGALADNIQIVDFSKYPVGAPPSDFEFAVTGPGAPGRWTVVPDVDARTGAVLEHVSDELHEDRFPLAIYSRLRVENASMCVRFRIVSGRMLSAGIAVGVRDPDSYYVVRASALEHRLDLLLVFRGKIERIESADAEVIRDRWHELG